MCFPQIGLLRVHNTPIERLKNGKWRLGVHVPCGVKHCFIKVIAASALHPRIRGSHEAQDRAWMLKLQRNRKTWGKLEHDKTVNVSTHIDDDYTGKRLRIRDN